MSNRYSSLPNENPRSNREADAELDAAFDSDDEDATETQPMNRHAGHSPSGAAPAQHVPGTYDFESTEFDWTHRPPPGNPPANPIGNSNGIVPTFNLNRPHSPASNAVSRLASRFLGRFGLGTPKPTGLVGGGTNNDGVFANVTAKPAAPVRVVEGDDTYMVPEDARAEAPPSYASAQADAVPPYFETTIHAPFSSAGGDMLIDSLPVGSLFGFLWNMLVSVSFQFIGFLLTYLLHSSHASRLGSRAGLGVTLIQYGFRLRSKMDSNGTDPWGFQTPEVTPAGPPTFATAADADAWHHAMGQNATMLPVLTDEQASAIITDTATEWLSFFLMTVGWFVLLTSVLGFYRVKRWERGISESMTTVSTAPTAPAPSTQLPFERAFGLRGISTGNFFRQGFGFQNDEHDENEHEHDHDLDLELGDNENDPMIPRSGQQFEDEGTRERAIANEQRLHSDLRAAGLL